MSKFKKQVLKDIERLENAIRQDREREFERVYGYPFHKWSLDKRPPNLPKREERLKLAYERLNTAHNLVQASKGYFGFNEYNQARKEILDIFNELTP